MEQSAPSTTKVATKWALISLLTGIVLTYVYQLLNLGINSPIKYLSAVIFIAFLLLAQKEYKDQQGGYIKFGEAFSTGFKCGLFAGLLLAIFTYIYLSFLSHEAMEQMLEAQKQAMIAKNVPAEQMEKGTEFMRKFGAVFVSFGAAVWYAILGVIFGLIGAAIFKKERSPFDNDDTTTTEPTV